MYSIYLLSSILSELIVPKKSTTPPVYTIVFTLHSLHYPHVQKQLEPVDHLHPDERFQILSVRPRMLEDVARLKAADTVPVELEE